MLTIERRRETDGFRAYRVETVRLLLADGSEWETPEMWVRDGENSLTMKGAAWDLERERRGRSSRRIWTMVQPPCLV